MPVPRCGTTNEAGGASPSGAGSSLPAQLRTYRIGQVLGPTALDERFERIAGFDLPGYLSAPEALRSRLAAVARSLDRLYAAG